MTTPAQTDQDAPPVLAEPIAVASLNARKPKPLDVVPDTDALQQVAAYLGFTSLRKMRFSGTLAPKGREDWVLSGQLGATIVQPCSVTLAPVTTRIDTALSRVFVANWHEPEGDEVEMTLDEDLEPLGQRIDLSALLIEALALAAPDFPRAPEAQIAPEGVLRAAPEGDSPLDDAAVKPFAALAALRDKMDRS